MSQFKILADDVVLTWDMIRRLALSSRASGFLQVNFLDKTVGELRRKLRDKQWGATKFGPRVRAEIAVAVDVLVEQEQAQSLEVRIERIRAQAERKIERLKLRHAARQARHAQVLEAEAVRRADRLRKMEIIRKAHAEGLRPKDIVRKLSVPVALVDIAIGHQPEREVSA